MPTAPLAESAGAAFALRRFIQTGGATALLRRLPEEDVVFALELKLAHESAA